MNPKKATNRKNIHSIENTQLQNCHIVGEQKSRETLYWLTV